jgi:predicted acyl esterase
VCEDYSAISCPVFLVGGWADGYPNAIPRLLTGLTCPRKALIGPWGHQYPEAGVPGPAIDFLGECVRWWDHWLKGVQNGVMDEPMVRTWLQDSVHPPRDFYAERPGRWVAEPCWPPISQRRELPIGAGTVRSTRLVGLAAGARTGFGRPGDAPGDQQQDDAESLCFDTEPLVERLELLGYPEVSLALSADQPSALVAVRLCEVAPSGTSALVSRGLLNLTHRIGHARPEPLAPGRRYDVRVRLNVIGYRVPAGHRLRVAVSASYWPWVWPSPRPVSLTVHGGTLALPARAPRDEDAALRAFGSPVTATPLDVDVLRSPDVMRESTPQLSTGQGLGARAVFDDGAWRRRSDGLVYDSRSTVRSAIDPADPLSAQLACERSVAVGRGDWQTRVRATGSLSASVDTFHVESELIAYEGQAEVFRRAWRFVIPRDLV